MRIVQVVKNACAACLMAIETRPAASALSIAIVSIMFYLPILWADFVYDDLGQIVTLDYIHKPSNIAEVATLAVMKTNVLDNSRPVMLLSLMADSLLWGRKPFGYHLTNLLLHTASSVMLFLFVYGVLGRLFTQDRNHIGALKASLIAGFIFALHPINSEAVCVPTFREDLLVVFFTLLMLNLAERFPYQRKTANILYCLSTALLIFAASAAKETGIVCPLFLLFYWVVIRRAGQWRVWSIPLIISFISAGAFAYLRFIVFAQQEGATAVRLEGLFSRITEFQPRVWVYQLLEIFWPALMSADHTPHTLRHITLPLAWVILIAVIIIILVLGRKNRGFFLGVLFYILAIAPTSNLAVMFRPMADRYLYFPMAGFCLALGSIICTLKKPQGRRLLVFRAAVAAVFIYLGIFLVQRVFVWQNTRSVWQDVVKKNPFSLTACNNLGFALYDDGEYEKALLYFRKAIELEQFERSYADPYAGLAITYDAMGRPSNADEFFEKAVALDGNFADFEKLVSIPLLQRKHAEKLKVIADRVAARPMTDGTERTADGK